jgi:hypothetical protein
MLGSFRVNETDVTFCSRQSQYNRRTFVSLFCSLLITSSGDTTSLPLVMYIAQYVFREPTEGARLPPLTLRRGGTK